MKLSRKSWNNYVRMLSAINKTAGRKMQAYIDTYGTDDVDALVTYAYALTTKYGEAASATACQMYDEIAQIQKANVPPAMPKPTQNVKYVDKAIRSTMDRAPSMLAATVSEMVKRTGAETTLKNAMRDGAYFAWVPNGDTCAFCITLASNGWRRASKKTINGDHAEHIHKNCDCEFAISFNGPGQIEGYDPDEYLAMYENAEGATWKDKVNSMRRAQYSANKDAINAQKRAAYAARKARDIVANGDGGGIIKSLDIDDMETATYGKNIETEVINHIHSTVKSLEEDGKFIYSEVFAGSIKPGENGIPLFQTEMLPNGLLRLNINTDKVAGKSLDELNQMIFNSKNTVCNSVKEALVHEAGHAKLISGKRPEKVEALYKELKGQGVKGISKTATNDGAESIAEIEVLIYRGDAVVPEGMKLYRKYMK